MLGGRGLEVSSLGLGCMGMSEFYGTADQAEAVATIHRALDLGVTLLDTADMYGPFTNERLVGRAIDGRRDRVVLATKFGNVRSEDGRFLGVNGRPEYVRRACEASLRRLGVGFVAYSPLGRGFLTGRFETPEDLPEDDWRRGHPRFRGENFGANLELVRRVEEIAAEKGLTPVQLALAWVLSRGEDVVPIPGTTSREHLEENVAAVPVDLDEEDLERIEEACPPGATAGDRYPSMETVNGVTPAPGRAGGR